MRALRVNCVIPRVLHQDKFTNKEAGAAPPATGGAVHLKSLSPGGRLAVFVRKFPQGDQLSHGTLLCDNCMPRQSDSMASGGNVSGQNFAYASYFLTKNTRSLPEGANLCLRYYG